VIIGLRRLGAVQHRLGDDAEALATFGRGLETCEAANQAQEQHCLVLRANRAQLLARSGNGTLALSEADAVAATLEPRAPAVASERAQAQQARAAALHALARNEEALAAQDAAIDILRRAFGEAHRETREAIEARTRLLP
jgi:hypothetical protein